MINTSLDVMLKRKIAEVVDLHKLRRVFCTLQHIVSEASKIFSAHCFIWIMRIVIRCCLSALHLSTQPWSDGVFVIHLIAVIVTDVAYDISHLSIMCLYAGRIEKSKSAIMALLIGLRGFNHAPI
ncbi:hypothetical protein NPIL_170391 [Nephila pilipes]|uniref:Uncharacterized protein n=1 Tax=Nephila pilipes TaxID=299642 RepID=A0A8X6U8W6_NEPPI|nr:hypothetical protein NPIL_170391 [Nephila pilipes]